MATLICENQDDTTIRLNGPLPTVYLSDKQGPTRPLRAGDRVVLATMEFAGGEHPFYEVQFATATVADVKTTFPDNAPITHYVTVTAVQPLDTDTTH